MTPVAATWICAFAVAATLAADRLGARALAGVAKLVASAAFVAVAVRIGGDHAFARYMLVGLACGAVGDAFLIGRGKRMFLGGLIAFLIGHLAYVAGLAQLVPPGQWLGAAGIYAALPVAVGAIALAQLWPRLGALRVPVIVYVAAIAALVVGAIAAYRAGALAEPGRTRLLAGAALFFVSDLAVARERFVARSFTNRLWGLPAYFSGQLLIAWSIA